MSYFPNTVRLASILFEGVDFTDRVVDITLSDSSGVKNGLIATDGEIKLAFRPGSPIREDYERNLFARGAHIVVNIEFPSGEIERHPRGSLYVVDSEFNPETEEISLSVGCKMAFHALDGDVTDLTGLGQLYLPETRQDYSSISQQLAAEGKIAWYDGYDVLQVEDLWSGETSSGSPEPVYISVFGVTAVAVSALNKARSIQERAGNSPDGTPYQGADPDTIDLEYEYVPGVIDAATGDVIFDPGAGSEPLREEIVTSVSNYFTQYPAIYYERKPNEPDDDGEPNLDNAGEPEDDEGLVEPRPNDCLDGSGQAESSNPAAAEDSPSGGSGNGNTNCMGKYQTVRTPLYVGVESETRTFTYYDGPGFSRSQTITENYGPALEANSQYFGDIYQVCRQGWATRCNPNGFCPTSEGTKKILLSRTIANTEFNPDGSVRSETTDTYQTKLSAAQTNDWRAGVEEGKVVNFRRIDSPYSLYRSQRVIVEYYYPKVGTQRDTTTYITITSRGQGLPQSMEQADALNGIKRTTRDRSRSNLVNAPLPPAQVTPEPPTQSDQTQITFPPRPGSTEAASSPRSKTLGFKETMPYPIMIVQGSGLSVSGVLNKYEDYVARAIKGSAQGLRLGESLREEIAESWKPNLSFRYYDPRYNTLISMRGDAHTWSITPTACTMTVDGLTVGFSNGEVDIPNNVAGVTTAVL